MVGYENGTNKSVSGDTWKSFPSRSLKESRASASESVSTITR